MKTRKYIAILASALTLSACSDMLDLKPNGQFTADLMGEEAVPGLLASAYAGLEAHFFGNNEAFAGPSTNWIFDVRSDDALKGGGGVTMEANIHQLEISNIFSDNVSCLNKWQNNYYAISRVHRAMEAIRNAESITEENKNQYLGELKTLRAFYYFDLVKIFEHLPMITEDCDPNYVDNKTYTQADFYKFIKSDLRAAYEMMGETSPQAGRFNKYCAAALLCKVYAFTQQWDSCEIYASYVINSGKYELYNNYLDMSKIDYNNMYESIIALQCSTADDNAHINWSNLLNVTYSYDANGKQCYGTGDDFFYGSQNLADAFRTDADGLPYLDEDGAPAEHVSENYSGNLDPRLDFTVGRIGFPFRGELYTAKWCRAYDVYGEYSGKKNCIDHNDPRMVQGWPWGASPLNFAFLRYADVLLLKAEALIEQNKDLGEACNLVNEVRQKAARSVDPTYLPVDIDATKAHYNVGLYPSFPSQDYARKAVRMERRLELAMEGHRWFDLVRWNMMEPGYITTVMNNYFKSEAQFHSYYQDAQMSDNEIFFPTPYAEVLNSNGLYQ